MRSANIRRKRQSKLSQSTPFADCLINAVFFERRDDFMGVQTTTIEIDQLTAARLQAQAEARGLTINALLRLITEPWNGSHDKSFYETASPEERARAVEEWANQHRSSAPPLSDEAISRDSIYGKREEKQL
jgi:hypothetical protein